MKRARGEEREGAGSPVADFDGLYRAHAGHVHRFALFLSGDHALADDIVSETFIRLCSARNRVDLTTVRAHLFAIARSLFLQDARHARRRADLDDRVVDRGPNPEQRANSRDELRAVLAALQTLPEVDRAALPFTFAFEGSRITFLLIRDAPVIGATWLGTAAVMWAWHVAIRRRLRVSGL